MKSLTKLTQTICEQAKPGPKQVLIWDGGTGALAGFCLRITPQRVEKRGKQQAIIGGTKAFWLKVTRSEPRSKEDKDAKIPAIVHATWVRIGTFMAGVDGDLTVEVARKRATNLKDLHQDGKDVRAIREEQKNPDDVAKLVATYLEDSEFTDLRTSSQKSINSYLTNHVLPTLGKRYVRDLTSRDMKKLYAQVRKDTSIVTANRVISLMSKLIGFAVDQDMRPEGKNPCAKLKKDESSRDRVMDLKELRVLGDALRTAVANWNTKPRPKDACAISDVSADALRFLLYSGLRLGEVLPLKWKDVDLDAATMRFTLHKTSKKAGTKRLPIPPAALAVLRARKAANEAADRAQEAKSGVKTMNPYIFRGSKKGGHLVGLERAWLRLREEAGLDKSAREGEVRLHDFRRTYHTTCVELGFGKMVGDLLIGHSTGKVHDAYTNLSTVGILLQASTEITDWLLAAIAGQNPVVGKKVSHA